MSIPALMAVMNKAGEASGATVEYKKRSGPDGSVIHAASEPEMEAASFQMQLAQLARMVEHLPRAEKLAFASEMRQQGNEKYAARDLEGASELWMQSLAGLDFGNGSQGHAREAAAAVQVPVLLNLAACCLESRKWTRTVLLANTAIELCRAAPAASAGCGVSAVDVAAAGVATSEAVSAQPTSTLEWKAHSRKVNQRRIRMDAADTHTAI